MPFYHLRIEKKNEIFIYDLDLSEKELLEEIVIPLRSWKPFIVKGSPIEPSDIEEILIVETDQSSDKILSESRLKRFFKKEWRAIGRPIVFRSDQQYVIDEGRNVTREFIKRLNSSTPSLRRSEKKNDVFIVHGHLQEPLKELRTMLSDFRLNPIILHEQPSGSRTIVEKLEKHSDVGYAFIILTPDDVGGSRFEISQFTMDTRTGKTSINPFNVFSETKILKDRARQNVILEFGYFIGLLGRDRVCCLYKGDMELPSDMQGIIYIKFRDSVNEVRRRIIKELKAAGYELKT